MCVPTASCFEALVAHGEFCPWLCSRHGELFACIRNHKVIEYYLCRIIDGDSDNGYSDNGYKARTDPYGTDE